MEKNQITVTVSEDDLYGAMTELSETGSFEWEAHDGTKILFVAPDPSLS